MLKVRPQHILVVFFLDQKDQRDQVGREDFSAVAVLLLKSFQELDRVDELLVDPGREVSLDYVDDPMRLVTEDEVSGREGDSVSLLLLLLFDVVALDQGV